MTDRHVGGALTVWAEARDATPDEQMEYMLTRYLEQNNPGVRDITFEWRWAEESSWDDDEGNRHYLSAHWVLFGDGLVST